MTEIGLLGIEEGQPLIYLVIGCEAYGENPIVLSAHLTPSSAQKELARWENRGLAAGRHNTNQNHPRLPGYLEYFHIEKVGIL